ISCFSLFITAAHLYSSIPFRIIAFLPASLSITHFIIFPNSYFPQTPFILHLTDELFNCDEDFSIICCVFCRKW
ncbi:hypothetical protein KSS87_001293, partial [Heliosperma pusillum]